MFTNFRRLDVCPVLDRRRKRYPNQLDWNDTKINYVDFKLIKAIFTSVYHDFASNHVFGITIS